MMDEQTRKEDEREKTSETSSTISIKINGEPHLYKENHNATKRKAKDALQEATEQVASAKEHVEDEFDWVLPKEEQDIQPLQKKSYRDESDRGFTTVPRNPSKTKFKGGKRKGFPLGSLLFATVFAVVIGVAFGFLLLQFVLSDEKAETAFDPTATPPSEGEPTEGKVGGFTSTSIPEMEIFVVQGGVFSTANSANTVAARLEEAGVPTAIVEQGEQSFLFTGVAPTLEEARQLASVIKEEGFEAYQKPFSLAELEISEITSGEKEAITTMQPVFTTLLTSTYQLQSSGGVGEVETLGESMEALQTLNGMEAMQPLVSSLQNGYETLLSYEEAGVDETIQEAQRSLLQFLDAYTALANATVQTEE